MGCRTPGQDDLCAAELANWSQAGAVDARWAFSRPSPTHGASRYIQDCIQEDGKELMGLLQDYKAHVYVCGSSAVASGVRNAFTAVYRRIRDEKYVDDAAEGFFNSLRMEGRFAMDIFG